MPALLLLSSCGKTPQDGSAIRAHYAAIDHAKSAVKILSDLGDSTLEYQADFEYNKNEADRLTVTAPEDIAGICLSLSGDQSNKLTVSYEDTILDAMTEDPSGTLPVDASSALLRTLCQAEPAEIRADTADGKKLIFLRYDDPDTDPQISRSVWLNPAGDPVCAEISVGGRRTVSLFFTGFTEMSPQS